MIINWKDSKIAFSAIGHRFDVSPETIGVSPLLKKVFESGTGCVSRFYQEGYSDTAFDELLKKIHNLKGRKVYENLSASAEEFLYMWDEALVEISSSKSKLITINCVSSNEAILAACRETAKLFSGPSKKGYVFAITRGHGGLQLTRIGYAGTALERSNYSSDVIADYDYVIEDLKSKDPSGRITIIDGPPGGGKTFIVKGMLMEASKAMFVIVPPNMVSSMGGPELLPLLIRTREDYKKKGSTVFVLEDADQCLAPRASDNMSSISTILNMGDGILGSLFDVRIIATTNAKAKDLDEAILRDMRLSKKITVSPLPYTEANVIFKRIIGDEAKDLPLHVIEDAGMMKPRKEKRTFSLAEIYKAARNAGWKPASTDKKDETFGSGRSWDIPIDDEEEEDYYSGAEYM